MITITANEIASIRFDIPGYKNETPRDASVIERYMRWFANRPPQLSDSKPEDSIYKPSLLEPFWLSALQQGIRKSVIPIDPTVENDGRWLSQEVADAASDFFSRTADLLPCEPIIYSSQKGDLVSEFHIKQDTLTIIVSPAFVVLFTTVNGEPVEKRITQTSHMRREVEEITGLLSTGQHGAVDTHK